jgi:hypothetical protein
MLDLAPDIRSGELRRQGFLEGFGARDGDPRIVGAADTEGDEDKAREAMAQLLREEPDVNVVYTVNEPAAFGAAAALEDAGRSDGDVILVSVDGGCKAIKDGVRPGVIDATAQQFPENMAREGVRTLAEAARGGEGALRLPRHRRGAHHGRRGGRRRVPERGVRRAELLGASRAPGRAAKARRTRRCCRPAAIGVRRLERVRATSRESAQVAARGCRCMEHAAPQGGVFSWSTTARASCGTARVRGCVKRERVSAPTCVVERTGRHAVRVVRERVPRAINQELRCQRMTPVTSDRTPASARSRPTPRRSTA